MRNNKRTRLVFLLTTVLLALCHVSCRKVNNTLYFHYTDLPSQGWDRTELRSFDVYSTDSVYYGTRTRLGLHLRYGASKPIGQVPFLVTVEDESGELMTDTIYIELFDERGLPKDAPKYGISEHTVTLIDNLPLRRRLSVSMAPLVPRNKTQGLLNVGVKLSSHGSDTASSREP